MCIADDGPATRSRLLRSSGTGRRFCDGAATAFTSIVTRRGEPPHIHVRRDDKMLKLWLSDLTIAASYGFARHEVRSIVRKVDEQRNALLEAWHAHFAHDR
jgi:hypothetical protein